MASAERLDAGREAPPPAEQAVPDGDQVENEDPLQAFQRSVEERFADYGDYVDSAVASIKQAEERMKERADKQERMLQKLSAQMNKLLEGRELMKSDLHAVRDDLNEFD